MAGLEAGARAVVGLHPAGMLLVRLGAWQGGKGHSAQLSLEQGVEGWVRVWELGELEEGREGPRIEVTRSGVPSRAVGESECLISHTAGPHPLSLGVRRYPLFPLVEK